MPPFVPRKRRSASPSAPPPPAKCVATTFKRAKPSLFDTLDQTSRKKTKSAEDVQAFLNTLDDSDEGLSDAKSDEFEDVISYTHKCKSGRDGGEEDEDDEMEDWEDAIPSSAATLTTSLLHEPNPQISGDLQITFNARGGVDAESSTQTMMGKKGPSKKERQARFMTHCMHVQFLLFHNLVRNAWISDKEVQKILVDAVNDGVRTEVKRWKKACGTTKEQEGHDEQATQKLKGKGKQKKSEKGQKGHRNQRDWGNDAEMLEDGVPNLSHGDPTLRLLKYLASYWKKRFKVTAPGLRKQGYKPLRVLRDEVQAFRKDPTDPNRFGERVESLKEFRTCAKECKGSRDIGAQLFTSLLRALGLEARMVTSLQPAGFGFSKVEEAEKSKTVTANGDGKDNPITVDDDSSLLSSADSYIDNDSITEVTPHVSPTAKQSSKGYDRDMPFPIYWTEVLSPISNMYIPVDATVLSTVANTQELVASFEPRGKQADKSKQVIAYVVAYNNDGCAKDVTVRYLKRRTIPGKTKGFRFPVQKVPIYNRKGKVARYEQFDWFKTVIRCYARDPTSRTLADELEDQGDLVPAQPDKKPKEGGTETLQAYKNSAEYVLERHLRREEAILPGSKSVKTFTSGKGDKAKTEPVFRRKDVVTCKTVESWHKEGRAIIAGAQPVKFVPMRAVTLMRKREIEAAERESGEKMKQGLYHERQTEWIIPDPIVDGKIPRNAFGNIDVYVPTMVPRGSVHIPLRGTGKVCKKLGIDYAEACTGFEFGHRMAVPVLTGVVVAVEHEDAVIDAWEADQREQIRKENAKREKLVLGLWKKFYTGLRIVERVKKEYVSEHGQANIPDEINPFVNRKRLQEANAKAHGDPTLNRKKKGEHAQKAQEDLGGGGFFHDEEEEENAAGGSPRDGEQDDHIGGGGFLIEGDENTVPTSKSKGTRPQVPLSLQALHARFEEEFGGSDDDAAGEPDDIDATLQQAPPWLEALPTQSENACCGHNDDAVVEVDDCEPPLPAKQALAQSGRGRGRPAKNNPDPSKIGRRKAKGKAAKQSPNPIDEDDSSLSELSDVDTPSGFALGQDETVEPVKPDRDVTIRRSARKSETALRSHYFGARDEETGGSVKGTGKGKGKKKWKKKA